jgi:hypothetical protein
MIDRMAASTPDAVTGIRPDLADAHSLAWRHIASPGSWFTAAQRIELGETVLTAVSDDDPLPPWVAWSSSDRSRDDLVAPAAAHDVAYRIARHAGTMSADVHAAVASELGDLAYVEVCAIVSTVAAVGHFHRNIGLDVPPFPEPVPGEPTGAVPDDVVSAELNWVPVVAPADQVAAVVQAYSAVPAELENTWRMAAAQYMPDEEMIHADWSRRPGGLSRPQSELIAARVAQLRECFY